MNRRNIFSQYILPALTTALLLAACHHESKHSATAGRTDSVFGSEMLKRVTDSIEQYPDSSRLYFERGGLLYMMKEYELAGHDIQKAITLDPLKADYYIALGEIQTTGNKLNDAATAYRHALLLDGASLMARLQLAYVLLQQKKYRQTIRQTDTLLQQDDRMAEAYGLQSQAYQALKDTARALSVMKKAVALAPADYDALMAVGDMLLSRKNPEALSYYRRARDADTTRGESLYCIGLFYEKTGRPDSAVMAYKTCIDRDAYYLNAYLKLGGIYENQNDWEKALKVYNLAIRISPVNSDAFYHRGLCHEKLNNVKAAVRDYENAVTLKSTNAAAQAALDRLKKKNADTSEI